jgi:hypothetical protein
MALAAPALGASHHPTGEFEQFGECPLNRATLTDCVYSVSGGGTFTIGKRTVPIENPVRLQGGFEGAGAELEFFGAENGDTLSKVPQPVPGGLLGLSAPSWWPQFLQDWFDEGVEEGQTAVTATVELAAPASAIDLDTEHLLFEEGTALRLPVKFKLENPLLGANCHIGSDAHPIQIDFTTATTSPPPPNQPISGKTGNVHYNKKFTLITISGGRLLNDSFAVPQGASGCGGIFSFFLNPLVDSVLGTPSPAGHNTAILEGKLQDAAASGVRESEK